MQSATDLACSARRGGARLHLQILPAAFGNQGVRWGRKNRACRVPDKNLSSLLRCWPLMPPMRPKGAKATCTCRANQTNLGFKGNFSNSLLAAFGLVFALSGRLLWFYPPARHWRGSPSCNSRYFTRMSAVHVAHHGGAGAGALGALAFVARQEVPSRLSASVSMEQALSTDVMAFAIKQLIEFCRLQTSLYRQPFHKFARHTFYTAGLGVIYQASRKPIGGHSEKWHARAVRCRRAAELSPLDLPVVPGVYPPSRLGGRT